MIRILVDSSADYTMEELKENGFEFVPLSVTLGDHTYLDCVELDRNHLYEVLENTQDFPKTSQPSPEAFAKVFEDAKAKGDDVICILLSSGLSGTCQSAFLAKSMVDYQNIYIIDSLSATYPVMIMADYAAKLRSEGLSAVEIVSRIEEIKSKVRVVAAIDTLEYLYRGGRLSRTSAALGSLANLKPVITLSEEGKIIVLTKCIGRNKSYAALIQYLEEHPANTDFPFYSIYSYGTDNSEKLESKLAKANVPFAKRLQIGSTIGAHLGPGTVGIVYVEK